MWLKILLITAAIELITVFSRIVFGSARENIKRKKQEHKIRIHHGYIGWALLIIYLIYPNPWIFISGMALFWSDFIHHFIVLKIWVGDTEFP